jgi:phage-related minor tail protein
MTRIVDAIDDAIRGAREADRRRREERSAVKEAATQPRTDLAQGLRVMASALRRDGGGHA